MGIVLLAMMANGERSFLVSFVGMVCIAGILGVMICRYRHKLASFCVIFLCLHSFLLGFIKLPRVSLNVIILPICLIVF